MINKLKKIFFPFDDGIKDENFLLQTIKTNFSRAKIVILATIIIEVIVAFLLISYSIKESYDEVGINYLIMYGVFILISAIFYFAIRSFQKNIRVSIKARIITYGYILFITSWNMALSFIDGSSATYIIAIMGIGLIAIFRPIVLFAILTIVQLAIFILAPIFMSESIIFATYVNTSVAAAIAFISGNIIFRNIYSNYAIHKEINSKSQELEKVNSKLNEANKKLEYLSQTDGLTGIYNRRMFDDISKDIWKECILKEENLAIIMIDIDHFKIYNDTYGHQRGDDCLKTIVSEMKLMLPKESMLARYGGEEFAVLVKGITTLQAEFLADKIRKGIEGIGVEHKNSPVHPNVTLSLGVYCGKPDKKSSLSKYINSADKALFEAKEGGRNIVIAG